MKKPSNRYAPSPASFGTLTPSDLPDPSLNAEAYDDLIQNRGILFTHMKAMPCPNVQDVESMIHVNHCEHPSCFNGFLQTDAKQVWGYFNNDQLNKLYEIQGEYNENIAIITLASVCTDGSEAEVHPYDQLKIDADYSKRVYELVEANPAGLDRLKYKSVKVGRVETATGRKFTQGTDYVVENGMLRWISQNRPGYDQMLQRGEAISVLYYIQPIFFVHHVMKELRATQVFDPSTGEKVAVRLPQHIFILRELLYEDPDDKVGDQTSKMPRNGVLPPR